MEERRRLPKNVRQVGERDELYRVYLEDYVGTYLEKCMSRQGELTIGVLVGENCVIDGNACLFINGALEVNHVWSNEDQLMFSEYSWERMLDAKARHFEKGEICGAFVCGGEELIPDMGILQKLQNRYFPETGSIMLVWSGEDSAVYYQNMAGMARLAGYYIYYERNEAMQGFLVESSQGRVVERTGSEPVVNQFREKMSEKKSEKSASGLRLAYGLCVCLALAVCAVGINSLGSTQKLTQMEEVLSGLLEDSNQVGATVLETDESGGKLTIYDVDSEGAEESLDTESDTAKAEGTTTETGEESSADETYGEEAAASDETATDEQATVEDTVSEESAVAEESIVEEPVVAEESIAEESVAAEESVDEAAAAEEVSVAEPAVVDEASDAEQVAAGEAEASALPEGYMLYTVSAGETLSSICINLYGSRDPVESICELNGIEDANLISVGQELVIPVAQ